MVRSFAELSDRSKIDVQPLRLQVRPALRNETFGEFLESLGELPVEPQELAILNQTRRREQVAEGHLLKVIVR